MTQKRYRTFQSLLLFGLFLFFIFKIVNNQLAWYINLRYLALTQIGIVFLAILAQRLFVEARASHSHAQEAEHAHEHDHTPAPVNLWVMLIPLLIGVLIPAKPLDSSAVSTKGLTTSSPLVSSGSSSRLLETESEQRNVLDWVKLFYFEKNLDPFIGQPASVTGFVYFDNRLPQGQFFVSRFIISCCAADGYAIGMIVDWHQVATLERDTWVQVKGAVDAVTFENSISPVIHAKSVEVVPQPDQPYLYP